MAESFVTLSEEHFDSGSNLHPGNRKAVEGTQDGETLADWTRRFKGGRETFGAGGNIDIVFTEAFPSTSYLILFGKSTANVNPLYANQVAAGFRITAAAAGVVDWMAIYTGPSA